MSSAVAADSQLNLAASPIAAAVLSTEKTTVTTGASSQEPQDARKNFNYPLIKYSDMADEMRTETTDMVVTVVEKHPGNHEAAAKAIKEAMDKKSGASWHVVIGEGFSFEITHEMRNLFYVFIGGNLGILVWKCS